MSKMQRALISLTDKSGIEDFAMQLQDLGIEILSTGGTAKKMRENGIAVKDVSEFTGFPEMLDGRVKTLHPKVHGGILYLRGNASHEEQMAAHGLQQVDLVAVNLYAFDKATQDQNCTVANAIENIDIGGPTMLRAAAKNFQYVTVIVDPADYPQVIAEIKEHGNTTLVTRFRLAVKVFNSPVRMTLKLPPGWPRLILLPMNILRERPDAENGCAAVGQRQDSG